jgi:hypothetical protein
MKYATDHPYSDAEKAARRLMEHAQAFEPIQDGRYREAQRPFSLRRQSDDRGIFGGPRSGDFAGLAGTSRERHVCKANAEWS